MLPFLLRYLNLIIFFVHQWAIINSMCSSSILTCQGSTVLGQSGTRERCVVVIRPYFHPAPWHNPKLVDVSWSWLAEIDPPSEEEKKTAAVVQISFLSPAPTHILHSCCQKEKLFPPREIINLVECRREWRGIAWGRTRRSRITRRAGIVTITRRAGIANCSGLS